MSDWVFSGTKSGREEWEMYFISSTNSTNTCTACFPIACTVLQKSEYGRCVYVTNVHRNYLRERQKSRFCSRRSCSPEPNGGQLCWHSVRCVSKTSVCTQFAVWPTFLFSVTVSGETVMLTVWCVLSVGYFEQVQPVVYKFGICLL